MTDIVQWTVYAHASKESMYEHARDAGLSDEEIEKNDIKYIGYEIRGQVTYDRTSGKWNCEWEDE